MQVTLCGLHTSLLKSISNSAICNKCTATFPWQFLIACSWIKMSQHSSPRPTKTHIVRCQKIVGETKRLALCSPAAQQWAALYSIWNQEKHQQYCVVSRFSSKRKKERRKKKNAVQSQFSLFWKVLTRTKANEWWSFNWDQLVAESVAKAAGQTNKTAWGLSKCVSCCFLSNDRSLFSPNILCFNKTTS